MPQCQQRDRRFDRPRGAQRVAVHGLGPADRHAVGVFAEDGLDGLCLHRVVERRAAGVCVDVADLLDGSIRLTQGEAHRSSRLGSGRQGGRHMVGVVGGAVAQDLPVDGGVTPHGVVQRFQHQHRRPFGHHKAVAVPVERPAGARRFLVAGRHGPDHIERPEDEGRERALHAAGQHQVGLLRLDPPERFTDGDCPRAAAVGVSARGSREPELDGDVARRRPAEHRQGQRWSYLFDAFAQEDLVLLLGKRAAPQRASHETSTAIAVLVFQVQAGIAHCLAGGRHRELREAVQALYPLRVHVGERVKVSNLGGHLAAKW